jgi:glutamate synthase domain-containing protein 2
MRCDGDLLSFRGRFSLFAQGSAIRGADDVFKLVALGADCVDLTEASVIAMGTMSGDDDRELEKLENFILGIQKEIKLLVGAAGLSQIHGSLVGNREILRSVDLDSEVRRELHVKPAGAG